MTVQAKAKGSAEVQKMEADAQDEIDKIMSEIEELQKEMGTVDSAVAPVAKPAPKLQVVTPPAADEDFMKEFQGSGSEPSMEETLAELKDDAPAGKSLLDLEPQPEDGVDMSHEDSFEPDEVPAENTEEDGSLQMTLTGNMTLSLKYSIEGETVQVGFRDNMLHVQLADGTEFKIPVRKQKTLRRAA